MVRSLMLALLVAWFQPALAQHGLTEEDGKELNEVPENAFADFEPFVSERGDANALKVIRPPYPAYPKVAEFFSLNGYCEVRFDIDFYDSVQVRDVSCTSKVFCYAAERGVKNAAFEVVDVATDDRPGTARNIVYPLVFVMYGSKRQPAPSDATPLVPCVEYPVS